MDFISEFLEHTRHYESPSSFWKWAAYSAISAVMRDNCYRRQGDITIYPNFYTLLLADSAVHRKGKPVQLCESLVAAVKNTKVISGRASIQAILDELGKGETDAKTGRILSGGSALFSAQELSASIVNDPEAVKILTDIYDFKAEFTSRLRGSGVFRVKNICFSMLAASNEDLLRDIYDTKAIFGGLLGRTFLIKPDEFRRANSLFDVRDTSKGFNSLVEKLRIIANLRGEFEFELDAQQTYDAWYEPFRESYRMRSDRSGIAGRIHTGALKLAMVLCVNHTNNMVITKQHVEMAIRECMSIIQNYQSFVVASGKATIAEVGAIVLQDIFQTKGYFMARSEILNRHWTRFDSETLDKFITTMSEAGMISVDVAGQGGIGYRLTEKCLKKLNGQE